MSLDFGIMKHKKKLRKQRDKTERGGEMGCDDQDLLVQARRRK